MKLKMLVLMMSIAGFCATAASACPPCDEYWPGTTSCTQADRFWYCCVYTDQCHLVEGELFATPAWMETSTVKVEASANATDRLPGVVVAEPVEPVDEGAPQSTQLSA